MIFRTQFWRCFKVIAAFMGETSGINFIIGLLTFNLSYFFLLWYGWSIFWICHVSINGWNNSLPPNTHFLILRYNQEGHCSRNGVHYFFEEKDKLMEVKFMQTCLTTCFTPFPAILGLNRSYTHPIKGIHILSFKFETVQNFF